MPFFVVQNFFLFFVPLLMEVLKSTKKARPKNRTDS